ncbi:MAG: hypothetical protein IPI50_00535 [Saprospiraceae bacterium]|nr:hypothetical protein [Saprospiraceae bacterium]
MKSQIVFITLLLGIFVQIGHSQKQKNVKPKKTTSEQVNLTLSQYGQRKNHVLVHYASGGGDYSHAGFGLALGRNILRDLSLGLGIQYLGQNNTFLTKPSRTTFPLSVDLKYHFIRSQSNRYSVLIGMSAGYNFVRQNPYFEPISNVPVSEKNGLYLNPSVGFKWYAYRNLGILFDIGYHYNNSSLRITETNAKISSQEYHNILFKFGILF